jgi:hypothetical protein
MLTLVILKRYLEVNNRFYHQPYFLFIPQNPPINVCQGSNLKNYAISTSKNPCDIHLILIFCSKAGRMSVS